MILFISLLIKKEDIVHFGSQCFILSLKDISVGGLKEKNVFKSLLTPTLSNVKLY